MQRVHTNRAYVPAPNHHDFVRLTPDPVRGRGHQGVSVRDHVLLITSGEDLRRELRDPFDGPAR